MPNWVSNRVKIRNGKKILDEIITQNENNNGDYDFEEETFDFEKIIPMPKTLAITCGGRESYAIQYAMYKMSEERKKEVENKLKEKGKELMFYNNYYEKLIKGERKKEIEKLEEENEKFKEYLKKDKKDIFDNVDYKELNINDLEDLGNTYINNIIDYGYDTWYDWSCENWGTKWNSSRTYRIDDEEVEFETAWSCPVEIFKALSKKYNTEVYVEYADEDLGSNCGCITFKNGEITNQIDMSGNLAFAFRIKGYSTEDIEDYYKWNNIEE